VDKSQAFLLDGSRLEDTMKKNRDEELLRHALAIGDVEAQEAGSLVFSARALVLASLPYRDPGEVPSFGRKNGGFSLSIQPGWDSENNVSLGFPYGNVPRLLLAWITTEAARKKSRDLEFGKSLTDFMSQLGLRPTGGEEGSIRRLRQQMIRLFGAHISCMYVGEGRFSMQNVQVASHTELWWDPLQPDDTGKFKAGSGITLGYEFFQEIINRPVPLDLRVIHAIKKSPLALDIYAWMTYRMSYLKKPTTIPWASLALQFGTDYTRLRDFKKSFLEQLAAVKLMYCHARFSTESTKGLTLYPSRPQVLKAPKDT
jgi:hypothetical protein